MGLFFLGIGIVWHILTREIRHYFIIREQRAKKVLEVQANHRASGILHQAGSTITISVGLNNRGTLSGLLMPALTTIRPS